MSLVVAKLGGAAIGAAADALELAAGRSLVLVHGGGAQISALMRRRGIEPRFHDGRRITDLPTLACVRHALASVSSELADRLSELGVPTAPLRRGEVIRAAPAPGLGLAGSVTRTIAAPVTAALNAGVVPLIAPLARDEHQRLLNVNADDAAAALAAELGADELVFLSDVPGVLDAAGAVLARVSASAPPPISAGMVPKLAAGARAAAAGVEVRIGAVTVVTT